MADPNKPIIDSRSTVVGEQPAAASSGNGNPPAYDPNSRSSSSVTTKVTTTGPISTTVPAEFTASSYDELIPQLEKRMAEYKPLSEDELMKFRRLLKI